MRGCQDDSLEEMTKDESVLGLRRKMRDVNSNHIEILDIISNI